MRSAETWKSQQLRDLKSGKRRAVAAERAESVLVVDRYGCTCCSEGSQSFVRMRSRCTHRVPGGGQGPVFRFAVTL